MSGHGDAVMSVCALAWFRFGDASVGPLVEASPFAAFVSFFARVLIFRGLLPMDWIDRGG